MEMKNEIVKHIARKGLKENNASGGEREEKTNQTRYLNYITKLH